MKYCVHNPVCPLPAVSMTRCIDEILCPQPNVSMACCVYDPMCLAGCIRNPKYPQPAVSTAQCVHSPMSFYNVPSLKHCMRVCIALVDGLVGQMRHRQKVPGVDLLCAKRAYVSHTKTVLPTRKSVPRSSRQSDHTKT